MTPDEWLALLLERRADARRDFAWHCVAFGVCLIAFATVLYFYQW